MLHQIGAGGLGPVFRAFEPERDRLVAVKAFRLDLTPERVAELAAELQRLIDLGLAHPSIAAPIDAGVEGAVAYLAQEYVAAESLDVALRDDGPAPAADALRLITQLAGAIDVAAAVGVHHGALHPRDILVAPEEARITGFGVSAALAKVGVRIPVRRPYAPPEIIDGKPGSTEADVFALAAIAHELLTGRRIAGTGDQVASSLGDVAGFDRRSLRDVFSMALSPEPQLRHPTALSFAAELKSAAANRAEPETPKRVPAIQPASVEPAAGLPLTAADTAIAANLRPGPVAGVSPYLFDEADQRASDFDDRLDRIVPDEAAPPAIEPFGPSSIGADVVADRPPSHAPVEEPVVPRAFDPLMAGREPPMVEPPDRPRSAMLPFALTLVIGLLVGFVTGYGLGSRERKVGPSIGAAPARPAATTAAAPGREWTEGAVPEAPQPAPPVAAPSQTAAPAPAPAAASSAPPNAAPRTATPDPRTPSPEPRAPSPRTPGPEPASEGRLLVRTTPSGARVSIDGRARGVTPLTVRDLPYGPHTITIVRAGYETEQRKVSLSPSRPSASVTVALGRAAAPAPAAGARVIGSVAVDSRPTGARVYLDDRLAGTTPIVVPEVAAGSHAIRIELEGYQRWSSSVRVVAGERARVNASLDRLPRELRP